LTETETNQQYVLNGISITAAATTTSLTNESVAAMCDFDKAFGSSAQQDQFDQQIQLQLQSILNGTAPAQLSKPPSPVKSKSPVQSPKPTVPSPIKQVESMPSLDDFFSIGGAEPLEQSSPVKQVQKPLKPKPSTTLNKPSQTNSFQNKSTKKQSSPNTTTPSKITTKNVQIRPKPTPSSPVLPKSKTITLAKSSTSEKIKFEIGDLDNVLQHVESIASLTTKTNDEVQKSNENFLYDLINIENQSNGLASDSPALGPSPNKPNKKQLQNLKKQDNNSPTVLSTPPSLHNKKPSKKSTKSMSSTTPVKTNSVTAGAALFDDNDFFSFLKEDALDLKPQTQHRNPLKPENHIQEQILTKKRGRPPKPSLNNASDSTNTQTILTASTANKSSINTSLGDNESLDLTDSENNSDSKKLCAGDEDEEVDSLTTNKCILNTAVENTFQDLINSKTDTFESFLLNGKMPRDKSDKSQILNASPNNKENTSSKKDEEDFSNFVYDIAVNGSSSENVVIGTEESMVAGEITIASLMSGQQNSKNRKRKQKGSVPSRAEFSKVDSEEKCKESIDDLGSNDDEPKRVRKNENDCDLNTEG